MAEVSRYVSKLVNVINVFHGVNLILYTVNNITPGLGFNVITTFCGENLTLFTFTSIHSIAKIIKANISKQQDER